MASRAQGDRRRRGPRALGVWLGALALAFVGFLYYQPVRAYLQTRGEVAAAAEEVDRLRASKRTLERRLAASTSDEALARQARALGLVKPGERLFIVKGIPEWRKRQRSRIGGDG